MGDGNASTSVAPDILALAGDVRRPRGFVPVSTDVEHLPGKSGLVAGARMLLGLATRGEDWLTSLTRRYGPVFRYWSGNLPMVGLTDADAAWSVLRNDDRTWSTALPWHFIFGGLLPGETGDSPLMFDFELHRDARRLMQPAFSAQAIASYLDDANRIYEEAIARWLARGSVPFKAEARLLFARVSAKILMGLDDPAEAERLDRAMTDGWQAVLTTFRRTRFSPGWRRAQRGMDTLWNAFRPVMDERRHGTGTDLLTRMCQTRDDADWLDDDTRMRMFISTMFAAFDTTAAAVTTMGYLLARHPEWQERLRAEARAAKCARVGPDDLKTFVELEWVWKEALRRYPVAGQVVRQALRDTELAGRRIPARTLIWTLTGTMANDPKWWTAPERFDPERFSPARAEDKRHKAIFLPFGAGVHSCIGAQLSVAEIKAFWHALLTRARIRLARDYEPRHTYTPVGLLSGKVDLVIEPLAS